MEALDGQYASERVKSVFIYTREAHPGERRPHHADFTDKLTRAREMVNELGIQRMMLVDSIDGAAHRAYGTLPNMTYIVARGGAINYRASWTDARTIAFALETLALARAGNKSGKRVLPYFMEWKPTRTNDARAFFDGLLEGGGERAVTEYIDAAARRYGEGHVKVHRRFWAEYVARRDG